MELILRLTYMFREHIQKHKKSSTSEKMRLISLRFVCTICMLLYVYIQCIYLMYTCTCMLLCIDFSNRELRTTHELGDVVDAERIDLAKFMQAKGYEYEAKYIKTVWGWRQACDRRGLTELQRCRFNYHFLNLVLGLGTRNSKTSAFSS